MDTATNVQTQFLIRIWDRRREGTASTWYDAEPVDTTTREVWIDTVLYSYRESNPLPQTSWGSHVVKPDKRARWFDCFRSYAKYKHLQLATGNESPIAMKHVLGRMLILHQSLRERRRHIRRRWLHSLHRSI